MFHKTNIGNGGMMSVLLLGLSLTVGLTGGCAAPAATPTPTTAKAVSFANPELLVDTAWLAQHLSDANVRVVDVRGQSGYQAGHIRNSVNLDTMDFKGPMYDQGNPVKWAVVGKDGLENILGNLGISNDTVVVAVDDTRGLWASRLFWTLEYYGHGNGKARVLDGGLKKWQAENRELTKDVPNFPKATFVAKADPSKLATKQQILDDIGKKDAVIVATIPEAEFRGGNISSAKRGGHVPGAVRADWTENLTTGDVPVLKSATELSALYEAIGATKDKNVIVY